MLVNYVFVYICVYICVVLSLNYCKLILVFLCFSGPLYLFLRDIAQNCNFAHGINKVFLSYFILMKDDNSCIVLGLDAACCVECQVKQGQQRWKCQ